MHLPNSTVRRKGSIFFLNLSIQSKRLKSKGIVILQGGWECKNQPQLLTTNESWTIPMGLYWKLLDAEEENGIEDGNSSHTVPWKCSSKSNRTDQLSLKTAMGKLLKRFSTVRSTLLLFSEVTAFSHNYHTVFTSISLPQPNSLDTWITSWLEVPRYAQPPGTCTTQCLSSKVPPPKY